MNRRPIIVSTLVAGAFFATAGRANAGGVVIPDANCGANGVTITWQHIARAQAERALGTIHEVEALGASVVGQPPVSLSLTSVSPGVWRTSPFAGSGVVLIDVVLHETITQPSGAVYSITTTPRVTITCAGAPTPPPPPPPPTTDPGHPHDDDHGTPPPTDPGHPHDDHGTPPPPADDHGHSDGSGGEGHSHDGGEGHSHDSGEGHSHGGGSYHHGCLWYS